jgi:hypothetical protein
VKQEEVEYGILQEAVGYLLGVSKFRSIGNHRLTLQQGNASRPGPSTAVDVALRALRTTGALGTCPTRCP